MVEIFGVPFLAPVAVDWPGTIVAINVGGAVIPILLSLYLLMRYGLWASGARGDGDRRLCRSPAGDAGRGGGHIGADIRPAAAGGGACAGVGAAICGPLAYIGGSLGVPIGADLLNLGLLRRLGAPVASIGGAGTFDGIFLPASSRCCSPVL